MSSMQLNNLMTIVLAAVLRFERSQLQRYIREYHKLGRVCVNYGGNGGYGGKKSVNYGGKPKSVNYGGR